MPGRVQERKVRILGIIPARGGSKGIKNKNIVNLAGKPLIQYTLEPAIRLEKEGLIEHLIISTDSPDIKAIAEKIGAKVPFLRPDKYAVDESKSIDLVLHAIDFFECKDTFFDAVILLQPTSPLRSYNDISDALNLFKKFKSESLISVCKEKIRELRSYKKNGVYGIPISPLHNKGTRRQDLDEIYIRNGAIYICKTEYIKQNHVLFSDAPLLFEMPPERSIDTNTSEDLDYIRWLLTRKSGAEENITKSDAIHRKERFGGIE
jgi:N-acylneuraminate cytidylyltransferase/CMP-N,N'-diacetyllegionaminic acid synthase